MQSKMTKFLMCLIILYSQSVTAEQYTDLLYQKSEDMESALRFVGAPEEAIGLLTSFVKGGLADQDLVNFSNRIIEARETRNVELFKKYVNQESLNISQEILNEVIDKIRDGSLIYGNSGYKYFVTSEPISDHVLERFYNNNVNKPSISLTFYHYHPSNGALIGSPTYLIKSESKHQIVIPVKIGSSGHNNAPKLAH